MDDILSTVAIRLYKQMENYVFINNSFIFDDSSSFIIHVFVILCIIYPQNEDLDGDNQYMCTQCDQKRDATRRIVLRHLPPVLNLQLLRFVYDR